MLEKLGIKTGMAVFNVAGQPIGSIDSVSADDFTVGGKGFTAMDVNMVEPSGVYLSVM